MTRSMTLSTTKPLTEQDIREVARVFGCDVDKLRKEARRGNVKWWEAVSQTPPNTTCNTQTQRIPHG